jgi:hypothetical protein
MFCINIRYSSVQSELKLTAWNVPGIQAHCTVIDVIQRLGYMLIR